MGVGKVRGAAVAVLTLVAATVAFGVAPPAASAASAGDLDPAFGTGGKVQTDLKQSESAAAAVVAANGRIVVAGRQAVAGGGSRILVARYLPSGALDTSFGQGGAVLDTIGKNPSSAARAVAIQPDGRILVAGSTSAGAAGAAPNDDTVVVRYLATGGRDPTFGSGGAVVVDVGNGSNDTANAVAVLPDGRIAVAVDAPAADAEWTINLLNADGTPSTTAPISVTGRASPTALAVAPGGKFVAGGFATPNQTPDFAFVRYFANADAGLDTGFGSKGVATVDFTGGDDEAFGMAVATDGSILASGFTSTPAGTTAGAVVKLTPAGVPDSRFGQRGRATIDFGTPIASVGGIALQPDGTIVVAGNADDGRTRRFALARLTAAGALDPAFGQGGRVLTSFTGQDAAVAVGTATGGDVVAAGTAGAAGASDLALAAYRTVATAAPTTTTAPPSSTTATSTVSTTTTTRRSGGAVPPPAGGAAPPTTAAPGGVPAAGDTPAAASESAPAAPPGPPEVLVSSLRVEAGGRLTASAINAPIADCPKVFFLVDGRVAGSASRLADGAATARLQLDESLGLGHHRVAGSCSARAGDAFATTTISLVGTARSSFVRAVRTPASVSTDLGVLAGNALLALLIVVLVAFPAELFNSTLDANYDEVTAWFAPWRRRRPRRGPARQLLGGRLQLVGFLLAGGLVYGLLDPGFGLNRPSLALVVGLVAGLLAVMVASSVATLFYVRRTYGERGRFECRPASIVVALVCVLLSRLLHFEPGYLFGLLGGYAAQRELPRNSEGALTAAGSVALLLVGATAWLVWLPVSHHAAHPGSGFLVLAADAALAAVFVASIEALAIGLLPLRFLNGSRVIAWSRAAWAALFGLSVFVFVHALLHPEDGYVSTSPRASVIGIVALAGAFGLASVLFWGYFRFRRPRATTTRIV